MTTEKYLHNLIPDNYHDQKIKRIDEQSLFRTG
jgi:hypothetical protein